jgi:hypothetical protein
MPINDNLKTYLTKVHESTKEKGYTFLNPKSPMVASLIGSGHIEADHGTKDPSDVAKVAVRVSDAGKLEIGVAAPAPAPVPAFGQNPAPSAPSGEATEDAPVEGVTDAPAERKAGTGPRGPRIVPVISRPSARMELPTITRGGGLGARPETYPFSALEAPITDEGGTKLHDSFFVHATDDNPNPAKSLAGTVSSATKRYKDEKPARKFSVVSVDNDSEFGVKGARVFRVA